MKSLKLYLLFQLFIVNVSSSQIKHSVIKDIFSDHHLSFKIAPSIYNKATVTGTQNLNKVMGTFSFGGEAGIDYYKNFNNNNGLVVGLNFGIAARRFTYTIPLTDLTNPPINSTKTRGDDYIPLSPLFYASIPVLYEHRWFKEKNGSFIQIGCNIKFPLNFGNETNSSYILSSDRVWYKFFSISEDWQQQFKPNFFISLGIGKIFLLKNNNLFKVHLNTQIATTNFIKANYQFTLPTQPLQNGTFNTNGSLVGLSFSYVLTNHRISNWQYLKKLKQKSTK
jgi:hypothetical protein